MKFRTFTLEEVAEELDKAISKANSYKESIEGVQNIEAQKIRLHCRHIILKAKSFKEGLVSANLNFPHKQLELFTTIQNIANEFNTIENKLNHLEEQ